MIDNLGLSPYDKKHKTLAKYIVDFIQARQNYHCGDCGKPFGINQEAQMYHLDGDKTDNKASNLIALCNKCYSEKTS